jgi:hypothetical protein
LTFRRRFKLNGGKVGVPLRFETTTSVARAIEEAVVTRLLAEARKKGISDPIVRDLIPNEDLKGGRAVGSGQFWQQELSGLTYVTVYSGENDDDRAFAIFKVANAREDPLAVSIKFFDGVGRTALKDIWQVEHAWLNPDCQAYCDPESIIFYGFSKGYNIDIMARKIDKVSMDKVIFGGKVVEPRGKTITPAVGPW